MKQPEAPCLGCPDREVGCHGKCEKYQQFYEECEKIREERKKIAEQNQVQREIEHRRIKMAAEGRFYRRHERR